jgi:hypothetical protein
VFRKADKVRKPGEKSVYQQNRGLQSHTSDREHQLQEQKPYELDTMNGDITTSPYFL